MRNPDRPRPWFRRFDWLAAAREYVQSDGKITIRALAERHGVADCTMGAVLRELGVKRGSDQPGQHGIVPREEFARLHEIWPSLNGLARHLGCNERSVRYRARSLGLPPRGSQPGRNGIVPSGEFARLYETCPTLTMLARHLGCGERSVRRRARALGLAPRGRTPQP
jgi:hypothetical protein